MQSSGKNGGISSRKSIVDLRSDTVTKPTEAMYDRMRHAPTGDDSLDGDPTAIELETFTARLLGKEAGLFVPTCTMANFLAILYPDHGADIDTILKNADSARYKAKQTGRNRYQLFNEP